ncbi:hypothetical protein C8Q80DRAFT_1222090 [Daedaleopsis nitida]|nr:hypothetical protein C8Q80DRAFT_1222090 [Daedaleopsis nitida]
MAQADFLRFRARSSSCYLCCQRTFSDRSGLTRHVNSAHRSRPQRSPAPSIGGQDDIQHTGPASQLPFDNLDPPVPLLPHLKQVVPLAKPVGSAAATTTRAHPSSSYYPFRSRAHFELADYLYRREQMSSKKINELMQILACFFNKGQAPPFAGHADLYNHIQLIEHGEPDREHFSIVHNDPVAGARAVPSWKIKEYTVFFCDPCLVLHNQMANPDFKNYTDYVPKRVYNEKGQWVYKDFASGDWVWTQADTLSADPRNHGAALNTVILGSNKTTNDFYPLYLTNGWVTNSVRHAHRNAITLIGFLAIPKTDRQYKDDPEFRKFRRKLFRTSLQYIFERLRPYMFTYDVAYCGDGYYCHVIYSFGPYIADYPKQVLLACTMQGWCPKYPFTAYFPCTDIHKLLAPDLLHQIIKGTFKDHLVTWVEEYLVLTHGKTHAAEIMADINRRITAAPPFPTLRRFPEGRGFKQWTGDASKALMKVYLPAIAGHLPPQMVRAISAFFDFCYLVRRDTIDEETVTQIDDALTRFHGKHQIFVTAGVHETISLPRQHAMKHYIRNIRLFGSPNGLCSSMMEAKHIVAVERSYRRSSKNNVLGQILKTNKRLDKLAALRVDLTVCGLLDGVCPRFPDYMLRIAEIEWLLVDSDSSDSQQDNETNNRRQRGLATVDPAGLQAAHNPAHTEDDDDSGAVNDPEIQAEVVLAKTPGTSRRPDPLFPQCVLHLGFPTLPSLIRYFLYDQLKPDATTTGVQAGLLACLNYKGMIKIFPSAIATFLAPSDPSGSQGMCQERIQSVTSWRGGLPHHDCVFVSKDATAPGFGSGFRGLHATRVLVLFSFTYMERLYECALVSWYMPISDEPDPDTGMWIVAPEMEMCGWQKCLVLNVISLDCIVRAGHLIGVSGRGLDVFRTFYVNKYADHHAFEIAY